jgi:acyl transferase domain-containing protein
MLDSFKICLEKVQMKKPLIRMISTVTGNEIQEEIIHSTYWLNHIDHSVLFKDAIETSYQLGGRTYLEMGPDSTLSNLSNSIFSFNLSKEELHSVSSFSFIDC